MKRLAMSIGATLLALGSSIGLQPAASTHAAQISRNVLSSRGVALTIAQPGLYRVSGSFLEAHGVSWNGELGRSIAVTADGHTIHRFMSTSGSLGPSSFVEFYGQPRNTMYRSTDTYDLTYDRRHAVAVGVEHQTRATGAAMTSYPALYTAAPTPGCSTASGGCVYEPMAPGGKWFYTQLIANAAPASENDTVNLSAVDPTGQASLRLDVWGVTDLGGPGPQHDIKVLVNNHFVLELSFSGSIEQIKAAVFPASWLRSGKNTVRLLLPGTVKNQYDLDITDVRDYTLQYPRMLQASEDTLTLDGRAGRRVDVRGLGDPQAEVWEIGPQVARVMGVVAGRRGRGYAVRFIPRVSGTYVITGVTGLLRPAAVKRVRSTKYLVSGHARLLVISPRALWPALQPLIAYHRRHGLSVKLADVADVFTRFSHGEVNGGALRAYIAAAQRKLGTDSVLLVGGDTYDYHGYLNCPSLGCPSNPGNVSLVPSLYTMDSYYGQIPSDELLVDRNGAPGLAIGRIPAMTPSQVTTVVSRTLAVISHPVRPPVAVMSSGSGDPEFQATSASLAAELPSGYTVRTANEVAAGHKAARQTLLDAIKAGATLVNFVGHGNLEQWSQNPLLSISDVKKLHPSTAGQVYFGWGCQTAYDVDPTDMALNARLLFDSGAVLALGSTGLDLAQPQSELAQDFFHELFHDPAVKTVGQALQVAEDTVLKQDQGAEDPVRSYELFGDPELPVTTLG